jgi:glycosyltransferase involved in cell wall biosynthesis
MVRAISLLPMTLGARLVLAGKFDPVGLEHQVSRMPGWERVEFVGWQSRKEITRLLAQVRLGLVLLHPVPEYFESFPSKLFEYMSSGIPVLASDFPLWREIVEEAHCGLLVNPLDTKAIAEAIQWILEQPREAEEMGKSGHEAVRRRYSWVTEAQKLKNIYYACAH